MISEGPYDTEDWSNYAKITCLHLHTHTLGMRTDMQVVCTRLPVDRQRKIVLSFYADVWVPLVQNLRVLLKHPLVPSGDTAENKQDDEDTPQSLDEAG